METNSERRAGRHVSGAAGRRSTVSVVPRFLHDHGSSSPLNRPIDLSVVIPLLNEDESLEECYSGFRDVLDGMGVRWEMILVNDGSSDDSARIVDDIASRDQRVRVVHHRRNYGKSAAYASGFGFARGEWVVTGDADLQQDPVDLKALWAKAQEGYDLVNGTMITRDDPFTKRLPSRVFNGIAGRLLGTEIRDINSAFKLFRQSVCREFIKYGYGEFHRYFTAIAVMKGWKVGEVQINGRPRRHGHTKFGAERYLRGFLDLLNVYFFYNYMERPLHLFGSAGLALGAAGGGVLAYLIGDWILNENSIGARPLLTLAAILVLAGVQLFVTGLLASMIRNLSSRESDQSRVASVVNIDRRAKVEWRSASRSGSHAAPTPSARTEARPVYQVVGGSEHRGDKAADTE